jgi:glycosyltransferase involved in cell wall biosynthesis
LICNVFFFPQSHGGATRVVEDNVRSFLRLDDLEIGVFCSDEGVSPAGQLQLGSFDGVPVYRLSTPIEPGMDWRPFNPDNASAFARVLDHFRPDIIHFHCIQRLTASIAEEALRRKIPYIVTLHDGWWISDHQFLVDEDGFLRLPTPDIIEDCRTRPAPLVSIERRQRLKALLQSADARLSVSTAFARIYENAGVNDVRVVENGLPDLRPVTPQPRADGRLALGHIGGRSTHKGAFLVEAALRQGRFKNLHLTMVDGTLAQGETVETTWGTTPVTLTGPYPQAEVHALYGRLNVLLAPSTWPESYGLVTREALSYGLWVIASDLGAIGDGIVSGHNGHVIDTTTAGALKQVLRDLDGNHERYLQGTGPNSALRPIEDQASELHKLYWEIARDSRKSSECARRNRAA